MRKLRVIISGGGTGGHIFPALSIAGKLKEVNPETEIIFVGAKGRMEMGKVPAVGYEIVGLEIEGLRRSLSPDNLKLPAMYVKSLNKAVKLIKDFKPDIAVGVGGYCSAPLLLAAQLKSIPTLIQEQNGFAGLANKILGRKANCICVAYEGMERFFPKRKLVISGNPIRSDIVPTSAEMKKEGIELYKLDPRKKHILVVGGSLGSKTLNDSMKKWIEEGCKGGENIEILWQCGKYYLEETNNWMSAAKAEGKGGERLKYVHHTDFIGNMALAYAAADIVISRSGASSISEICAAHKAAIFVPSPNVTEDHQTHNAMALVNKNAAMLVKDQDALEMLMKEACALLADGEKIKRMEDNAGSMAKKDAAQTIVNEIYRLVGQE